MVHIHNGILLSHKREHILVRSDEVDDLELILQSEMNQKEKEKYCILTHKYRIQKNSTEESIYRAAVEKQIQTYGHGERGREGEMYGKSNMETYIAMRKIDSKW